LVNAAATIITGKMNQPSKVGRNRRNANVRKTRMKRENKKKAIGEKIYQ